MRFGQGWRWGFTQPRIRLLLQQRLGIIIVLRPAPDLPHTHTFRTHKPRLEALRGSPIEGFKVHLCVRARVLPWTGPFGRSLPSTALGRRKISCSAASSHLATLPHECVRYGCTQPRASPSLQPHPLCVCVCVCVCCCSCMGAWEGRF